MIAPFGRDEVEEVPLPQSPLVRAIGQVRYPQSFALGDTAKQADLRKGFSDKYPVVRKERQGALLIGPDGVRPSDETEDVFKFQSKDGLWQVTVTATFVSLDTGSYESRADFMNRFGSILRVVHAVLEPPIAERLGVRYINRIVDPNLLERLPTWVLPGLLGGLNLPLGSSPVRLLHTICESVFEDDENATLARWGLLPPGAVSDQSVLPVEAPSWQLDIDSFVSERMDFLPDSIQARAGSLASKNYRFFRSVTTDEFLRHCGGEI